MCVQITNNIGNDSKDCFREMKYSMYKLNHVIRSFAFQFYSRKFCNQGSSTIYSVSSGQGKCGVAVIRISGPESSSVLSKMVGLKKLPEPRKALLRRIKHPDNKEILDQGLVIWFPGPHSFTGEDSCELQVHGGSAVVSAVLGALATIPRLRPALPGEFTKRAFYSNKLDLTEVEGLADLIHAETEMQRKQALHQMEGALHHRYSKWRQTLSRGIAHVEAYIDFSEDHNIEEDILVTTNKELRLLQREIESHLQDGRRGERLRDGIKTVIVGAPNVGKSSLLNALCERPAAIVSPAPGTTRDVVSSTLDLAGYPVVLSDTAGLRSHTSDPVEKEGILRAHQTISDADLMLLVIDATHYHAFTQEKCSSDRSFVDFLRKYITDLKLEERIFLCGNIQRILGSDYTSSEGNTMCLVVFNKLDLIVNKTVISKVCDEYADSVTAISCESSEHIEPLLDKLRDCLGILCGNPTRENASLSQARHRYHVTASLAALNRYLSLSDSDREIDLAAHELRQALNALGHVTGHVSTEQILDVIFRDFCIGK